MPGSAAGGRHVATPVTTTLQPVWLAASTWSTSTSTLLVAALPRQP